MVQRREDALAGTKAANARLSARGFLLEGFQKTLGLRRRPRESRKWVRLARSRVWHPIDPPCHLTSLSTTTVPRPRPLHVHRPTSHRLDAPERLSLAARRAPDAARHPPHSARALPATLLSARDPPSLPDRQALPRSHLPCAHLPLPPSRLPPDAASRSRLQTTPATSPSHRTSRLPRARTELRRVACASRCRRAPPACVRRRCFRSHLRSPRAPFRTYSCDPLPTSAAPRPACRAATIRLAAVETC